MKSLYVISIENFSGKTAVCLGVGRRLQAAGKKIGYFKPVSYEPVQFAGRVIDEDVTFVKNVLALDQPVEALSTLVLTEDMLREQLRSANGGADLVEQIVTAAQKAGEDKDILLVEGGGSLRQGYVIGLSTPFVAEKLDAEVLAVVKFRGKMRVLDDILAAQFRLGERLLGVIVNRVPAHEQSFMEADALPYLEQRNIPVFGVLPERQNLASISVQELADVLQAEVLAAEDHLDGLVEELVIGAMGAQEALSRFRMYRNKAVITGGDRADMQLAALETSTACLILTGNLMPSAAVIDRASEQDIPVLLVKTNTIETIEAIEEIFGKTRLGQAEKLAHFESLMAQHVDFRRLLKVLGV